MDAEIERAVNGNGEESECHSEGERCAHRTGLEPPIARTAARMGVTASTIVNRTRRSPFQ